MKILTVIPARGGSKSVLKKNIKSLNGRPLIEYTFDSLKHIDFDTDIIVSTDDKEIANISVKNKINVPFIRPSDLSSDTALTKDVLLHALKFMEKEKKIKYSSILLLQPTSPFRTSSDINDSVKRFKSGDYDSLVSVTDVCGNHPFRMKEINNGYLYNFIEQGFEDMRPRQELTKVYIRNGSIYLMNRSVLLNNNVVGERCCPYVMDELSSINIDTVLDFKLAELISKGI